MDLKLYPKENRKSLRILKQGSDIKRSSLLKKGPGLSGKNGWAPGLSSCGATSVSEN